ncbi:MAG: hypothetical protein IT377_25820 [Polyangiaceae bacterium]|nr:hypothetical protein [Polyangiaceae bacterium]
MAATLSEPLDEELASVTARSLGYVGSSWAHGARPTAETVSPAFCLKARIHLQCSSVTKHKVSLRSRSVKQTAEVAGWQRAALVTRRSSSRKGSQSSKDSSHPDIASPPTA